MTDTVRQWDTDRHAPPAPETWREIRIGYPWICGGLANVTIEHDGLLFRHTVQNMNGRKWLRTWWRKA